MTTITPLDALRELYAAQAGIREASDLLPGCRARRLQRAQDLAARVLRAGGDIPAPPITFESLCERADSLGCRLEADLPDRDWFRIYGNGFDAFARTLCPDLAGVAGVLESFAFPALRA